MSPSVRRWPLFCTEEGGQVFRIEFSLHRSVVAEGMRGEDSKFNSKDLTPDPTRPYMVPGRLAVRDSTIGNCAAAGRAR